MRLQLIRYESVELTEQLMREKQNCQEDDSGQAEARGLGEESLPTEMQVELRGVLLEEQEPEVQSRQDQDMLYVLSEDLSLAGDSAVMLQLPESTQEQGIQV